jgi:hypothetical protein
MTKIEQIRQEAASLSEDQLEAALEFIRHMKAEPFLYSAPPEVWESIERGRDQIKRGEGVTFAEAARRLERAVKREDK